MYTYRGEAGDYSTWNLYTYCANNPIKYVDPSGHWFKKIKKAAKKVAGAAKSVGKSIVKTTKKVVKTTGKVLSNKTVKKVVAGTMIIGAYAAGGYYLKNVTLKGSGGAIIKGAADGYLSGAATGALTGAASGAMKGPTCFVAGTKVLTEAGNKNIEDINIGDEVYSANEATGEISLKKVTNVYVNMADTLVHLYTNGEVITTTETHPFYVADRGWVRAKDLKAGTILVTETGQYVKVDLVLVEECEAPVTVYNLEIEDFHTYFVGGQNVWVHNTCGKTSYGKSKNLSKKSVLKEKNLPTTGKIRFVPSKGWTASQPLKKVNGGFVDRFNNVWIKGSSRTVGETFEWDVQLSKIGREKLGWLSRDNSHLNVLFKGKITHK